MWLSACFHYTYSLSSKHVSSVTCYEGCRSEKVPLKETLLRDTFASILIFANLLKLIVLLLKFEERGLKIWARMRQKNADRIPLKAGCCCWLFNYCYRSTKRDLCFKLSSSLPTWIQETCLLYTQASRWDGPQVFQLIMSVLTGVLFHAVQTRVNLPEVERLWIDGSFLVICWNKTW